MVLKENLQVSGKIVQSEATHRQDQGNKKEFPA
jgi:hypothetical protein